MTFHVGQKVVCIRDIEPYFDEAMPEVGRVYTVRSIEGFLLGVGIRLVEIINPPRDYSNARCECSFWIGAFRPVVEKKTDISIFTALLNPSPAKETERV